MLGHRAATCRIFASASCSGSGLAPACICNDTCFFGVVIPLLAALLKRSHWGPHIGICHLA
jgi:hypothetical protein